MRRTTRSRRGLLRWLTTTGTPLFVIDERRVVLFFNRGCEALTGWTAADVIGRTCDYATRGDSKSLDSVTGRLCPPPEVLAGQLLQVSAELLHRDGTARPCAIYYFPLTEDSGAPPRILGIVAPRGDQPVAAEPAASRLHAELAALHSALLRPHGEHALVGTSSSARRIREQIRIAAGSMASVHLCGERGTGKERIARLIHAAGPRQTQAFVPLDCERLAVFELKRTLRRLLDVSEGASREEALRAGSVFLRGAGALPRDLQELLVAARRERAPAWQLLSAHERPLTELLPDERLLPEYVDLLCELTINVPPLRALRDDFPLIAQHRLEELNRGEAKQVGGFSPEVWDLFAKYDWPGNLSELEDVIREARAATATPLIMPRDLPFRFRTGLDAQAVGPPVAPEPVALEELLARVEADYIRWALASAKSNKSQAAALLGLTRPRLYRRMSVLGIADED